MKFIALLLSSSVVLNGLNTDKGINSKTSPPAKHAVTSKNLPSKPKASDLQTGQASFSYKVDGRVIAGKGTGNGANEAKRTKDGRLRFVLMQVDLTEKAPPQIDFAVKGQGTTVITRDDMDHHSSGDGKYFFDFSVPPLAAPNKVPNYEFADKITVTILSNGSRVTGRFSGHLRNPKTKKIVALTDGTFDLPISAR